MARILVMEDEVEQAELFATVCRTAGHTADIAYSSVEARALLSDKKYDVVLADLVVGAARIDAAEGADNAVPLLSHIARIAAYDRPEVIVVTPAPRAVRDGSAARLLPDLGARLVLEKPVAAARLLEAIDACALGRSGDWS